MEPNLNASVYRRLVLLSGLLLLGFAALGGRLIYLHLVPSKQVIHVAIANHQHETLREPRRGEIRDIRNRVLASSTFVKTVCADPSVVSVYGPLIARTLAPILQMPEAELARLVGLRMRTNDANVVVTNRFGLVVTNNFVVVTNKGGAVVTNNFVLVTNKFVVLRRKVPNDVWQKAQFALATMPITVSTNGLTKAEIAAQAAALYAVRNKAVFADAVDDQQRVYPNRTLAAHVVGYLNPFDNAPVRGIEASMNEQLTGVRGWMSSQADKRRREVVSLRSQDVQPRNGLNVVLTLDATAQYVVEEEIAEGMRQHTPISISAIVVRPKTGQILAMATCPTVDLNSPTNFPQEFHRNQSISAVAEPGSTFKSVVVAAGLNERVVTLRDRIDCENGEFHYAGRVLHDHDHYGVLSVEEIITKSSNIGAAKIGLRLGEQRLYDYIRAFGFGERSNVMLDREENGIVRALPKWTKVSNAWIPMGHEVMVTPLQMVMAMSAIANGGKLMAPMLVDHVEDEFGTVVSRPPPQMVRQVVSAEAARLTVQALKTVVSTNGTAPKARLELYTVAGKTGTAQKAIGGAYVKGKYFSSFIGFFPADDPELCISVVMDEPRNGYYGGHTAAPVFKKIAERLANYLNIRPDLAPPDSVNPGTPPTPGTPGTPVIPSTPAARVAAKRSY